MRKAMHSLFKMQVLGVVATGREIQFPNDIGYRMDGETSWLGASDLWTW